MEQKTVDSIIAAVRSGAGLQDEIVKRGLPVRESMLWFRDNASNDYYQAKKERNPAWKPRTARG